MTARPMIAVNSSSPPADAGPLNGLLRELLRDQQDLSAVERFAQDHASESIPRQSKYYRSLLPAAEPGPGQQYAFEVNLDRCSGCKACVTACHSLNGLDPDETWRDVGLLIGGSSRLPVVQHVTTACHHCVDPGCMNACPTLAYEKDARTGIVKHLDDQCFGCQYCVLACPYDVPKYSPSRGIVRKCDMCSSRLSAGEAPACVQACPHEAIRISIVDVTDSDARAKEGRFLPHSPDPRHTRPTTQYITQRAFPGDLRTGDAGRLDPEHAHVPLVAMLVISQASVGFMLAGAALLSQGVAHGASALIGASWLLGLVGIMAATLHLGRPWLAHRAVLGLRRSWLSREIVAFGAFQGAAGFAATLALGWAPAVVPGTSIVPSEWTATAAAGAGGLGLLGVFCSVMIYAITPRRFWRFSDTALKFAGTTATFGWIGAMLAVTSGTGVDRAAGSLNGFTLLALGVAATAIAKLFVEHRQRMHPGDDVTSVRAADLLQGPLSTTWAMRVTLGLVGGALIPLAAIGAAPNIAWGLSLIALVVVFAGELCERTLFFQAAAAPRMPGGIAR